MAAAARIHIVEKGKDPRAYAMVGFGGAGPAHAAEVARVLGVKQVLIPPASGAASALGFLAAPLSFEQVRSHPRAARRAGRCGDDRSRSCANSTEAARARLAGETVVVTERLADMRLEGQMHEISVRVARRRDHRRHACRDPRGIRRRLCRAIYVCVCRRRRHGGLVPRALPWPVAAAFADRGRRAIRRRGTEGHARGLVRWRLRRYAGL